MYHKSKKNTTLRLASTWLSQVEGSLRASPLRFFNLPPKVDCLMTRITKPPQKRGLCVSDSRSRKGANRKRVSRYFVKVWAVEVFGLRPGTLKPLVHSAVWVAVVELLPTLRSDQMKSESS